AGTVVLAAGMGSQRLADNVGLTLPMHGGTGYVIDVDTVGEAPGIPLSVSELRVVATPYPDRFRMSGTLEFSTGKQGISERRVQAIRDGIAQVLPTLRIAETRQTWAGDRPCTAD